MKKYKDDHAFKNAVIKLKNVLDNDESIRMISEHENTTRVEIKNYFKEVYYENQRFACSREH